MARIITPIAFEGPLGNVTAYKMRGMDKIILRTKGGPSRERIRTSPAFEQVRRNNAEFSGRSTASKWILRMLGPLKRLADHNIAGPLNALLKPVQEMDPVRELGRRHVQLSKAPHLLCGFSLNRGTGFDTVVRTPLTVSLSRDELRAVIEIPALLPRINFFVPGNFSHYSILATLGIVPDLFNQGGRYETSRPDFNFRPTVTTTPWLPVSDGSGGLTLALEIEQSAPEFYTLMLSVGIRYGLVRSGGVIEEVRYAGSAKVVGVV